MRIEQSCDSLSRRLAEEIKKRNKKGQIIKGHTLNPGGMPKELWSLKNDLQVTSAQSKKAFIDISRMNADELTAMLSNPQTSAVNLLIGRLFSKAISGSLPHANAVLDRIIGAVPKNIQALDENGKPKDTQISILEQMDTKDVTAFVVGMKEKLKEIKDVNSFSQDDSKG